MLLQLSSEDVEMGALNLTRSTVLQHISRQDLEMDLRLFSIFDKMFRLMPFVLGVPTCALNLIVFVSIVLIVRRPSARRPGDPKEKPAFVFVGNLALSDLLAFVTQIVLVCLHHTSDHKTYSRQRLVLDCQIELIAFLFCMANTLFSSILITVDRYIYITRGMRYPVIVTKGRVIGSIALVWVLPIVWSSVLVFVLHSYRGHESRCIYNHLVAKSFIAFGITAHVSVFLAIYVLYGIILIKFYRRKRNIMNNYLASTSSSLLTEKLGKKPPPTNVNFPVEELAPGPQVFVDDRPASDGDGDEGSDLACQGISSNFESEPARRAHNTVSNIGGAPFSVDDDVSPMGLSLASSGLRRPDSVLFKESDNGAPRLDKDIVETCSRSGHSSATKGGIKAIGGNNSIRKSLVNVGKFIQAAQYVITLILVFTLAWIPSLILICKDIIYDTIMESDGFVSACPLPKASPEVNQIFYLPNDFDFAGLEMKIQELFEADNEDAFIVFQYNVTYATSGKVNLAPLMDGWVPAEDREAHQDQHQFNHHHHHHHLSFVQRVPLCALLFKAIHSYRQHYWQMFAVVAAMVNSLINPIIYAFCYPEFRMQLRCLPRYVLRHFRYGSSRVLASLCCRKASSAKERRRQMEARITMDSMIMANVKGTLHQARDAVSEEVLERSQGEKPRIPRRHSSI